MVRLATHKLIVSVDAVVGVELLATTLAGKHNGAVLSNFVLAKHLPRLESFVTDITGVNPLSLLCFVPPTLIGIIVVYWTSTFKHFGHFWALL